MKTLDTWNSILTPQRQLPREQWKSSRPIVAHKGIDLVEDEQRAVNCSVCKDRGFFSTAIKTKGSATRYVTQSCNCGT